MQQNKTIPLEKTTIAPESINLQLHPTLATYFETFNQGDFQTTAALFSSEGQMLPPFESAIVGPEAIATYLEKEAKGMTAHPQQTDQQSLPSGNLEHVVVGQVQTALFKVNVRWQFLLSSKSEILRAEIKLLAALQDLLRLKKQEEEQLPQSKRPV